MAQFTQAAAKLSLGQSVMSASGLGSIRLAKFIQTAVAEPEARINRPVPVIRVSSRHGRLTRY